MNSYHARGPVPIGSQAYVSREFEKKVLNAIHSDRWVLMLGPRQHGKTTSLIRIHEQLKSAGYLCVLLDLQALPPGLTYRQHLEWVAGEISNSLHVEPSQLPDDIHRGDLSAWLRRSIPPGMGKVVVMIDEAAAIRDQQILETFYAQLRAIHNRKAAAEAGSLEKRLILLFSGTFLPERLIQDSDNSPFNICEAIDTDDLTLPQIEELQTKVEGGVDSTKCNKIFNVVGGQPFLVQKYMELCLDGLEINSLSVDEMIDVLGLDGHFESVFRDVRTSERLLGIVRNMNDENQIHMQQSDSEYRYLIVCGIASATSGILRFRCEAYARIARQVSGVSMVRND